MLSPAGHRESFAGKLLLSSALVAVSLAYGWWQRDNPSRPVVAMAPMPMPPAPKATPAHNDSVASPPAPMPAAPPATASVTANTESTPKQAKAAPVEPKSPAIARAAPQTDAAPLLPASPT